jgi:GTPase involved in cell partitioning and DNA repair
MNYKGARIQVLDLPGIIEGAADGKGRGRQVISTARTCNMILVVLDASKPLTHKKIIESELFGFGIRINETPPDVKIVRKESGGIGYQESTVQTKGMCLEVARVVLKEYKISCAEGAKHLLVTLYLRTSTRHLLTYSFSFFYQLYYERMSPWINLLMSLKATDHTCPFFTFSTKLIR